MSDFILPIADAFGSGLYDPFAQFARADGPDLGHTILSPLISYQNFVCSCFQAVTAAQQQQQQQLPSINLAEISAYKNK